MKKKKINGAEKRSPALSEMQAQIHSWVSQFKEPYWPPLAQISKLTEELGEVAYILNRAYGPGKPGAKVDKKKLAMEIGDILVLLVCLANAQGTSLDEAWRVVMKKNTTRDLSRWK